MYSRLLTFFIHKQQGFMSLICLCYFLLFLSLILNLSLITLTHTRYVTEFRNYVSAYAEALSGLRVINKSSSLLSFKTYTNEPTLDDFNSNNNLIVSPFKFNLYKTTHHVYSFSKKQNAICILKARYRIDNSIVILSELTYFFRR